MTAPDFDAARRERARGREPIRFTLGGEEFETLAVMPAGIAIDLVAGGAGSVPFRQFLLGALRDDDGENAGDSSSARMADLLYRRDDPIDPDAVIEVVEWIAEEYTGRPTGRSTDSSAGPPNDGVSSKAEGFVEVPEASTG